MFATEVVLRIADGAVELTGWGWAIISLIWFAIMYGGRS